MTKKFTKGDRVLVHATVYCGYQVLRDKIIYEPVQECQPGLKRSLARSVVDKPYEALVVGYSYRQAGIKTWDEYEGSSNYLMHTKRHSVVMVQPTWTSRWLRPYACLEEDLELCE